MLIFNKRAVLRTLLILCISATLIFIWSNSLADAKESTEMSSAVIEKVKPIVDPYDRIEDDLFVKIVRKAAHFSEFALLGAEVILLYMTFDKWRLSPLPCSVLSIGICFVFAVIDELLQLTSDGRSCEFTDMMIDLGGIIAGALFVILTRKLIFCISGRTVRS